MGDGRAGAIIRAYYDAVDAGRLEAALEYFTEDAQMRIANDEPLVGREAINAGVQQLLSSFERIQHTITRVLEADYPTVAYEALATYTRHDGSTVTLPGAVVAEFDGDYFRAQYLYIDFAPIFAAAAPAGP